MRRRPAVAAAAAAAASACVPLLLLLLLCVPHGARAAVHPYAGAFLESVNDAYVYKAGREGLFRSQSEARRATASARPREVDRSPATTRKHRARVRCRRRWTPGDG